MTRTNQSTQSRLTHQTIYPSSFLAHSTDSSPSLHPRHPWLRGQPGRGAQQLLPCPERKLQLLSVPRGGSRCSSSSRGHRTSSGTRSGRGGRESTAAGRGSWAGASRTWTSMSFGVVLILALGSRSIPLVPKGWPRPFLRWIYTMLFTGAIMTRPIRRNHLRRLGLLLAARYRSSPQVLFVFSFSFWYATCDARSSSFTQFP